MTPNEVVQKFFTDGRAEFNTSHMRASVIVSELNRYNIFPPDLCLSIDALVEPGDLLEIAEFLTSLATTLKHQHEGTHHG